MTQITLDASKGQLVAYVFGQDALAASQTDVQLPTVTAEASQAVDGYTMPFAGDVVAVAWSTDTAVTAGQLTIGATIGGTEDTDTTVTITAGTGGRIAVPRGKCSFAAAARLGCEITTNAGFTPVAADLVAVVYVLHDMDGI